MTDVTDPQTVVEPAKEVAQPTSTEGSAPDDLDTLLNEFEQGTSPPAEQPATKDASAELLAYIREERENKIRTKTEQDIANAVKTIKDGLDIPVKVSDRVVRGLLHDFAASDSRFALAFQNRDVNPQAWNKVLKAVQKQVREDFSVDQQATETREAVAAAVRSASKTAPEPQKDFDEKAVRRMDSNQLMNAFPDLKKSF